MRNEAKKISDFFSNDKTFPVLLFCASAFLLFGATLFWTDFGDGGGYPPVSWTEPVGFGLSAPACGSATPSATCVNGATEVVLVWELTDDHGLVCDRAELSADGLGDINNLPCSGSYTFSGLPGPTTYPYTMKWLDSTNAVIGTQTGTINTLFCGGVPPPPPPPPPPGKTVVNIFAKPSVITKGQSTVLTWSSNGTSCAAPWTSSNAPSGSQLVSPTETTFFSIACIGPNGLGVGTVLVYVGVIDEPNP